MKIYQEGTNATLCNLSAWQTVFIYLFALTYCKASTTKAFFTPTAVAAYGVLNPI